MAAANSSSFLGLVCDICTFEGWKRTTGALKSNPLDAKTRFVNASSSSSISLAVCASEREQRRTDGKDYVTQRATGMKNSVNVDRHTTTE